MRTWRSHSRATADYRARLHFLIQYCIIITKLRGLLQYVAMTTTAYSAFKKTKQLKATTLILSADVPDESLVYELVASPLPG